MRLLYLFPEPLPLPKARGIQVVQTIYALAQRGLAVDLAYVPAESGVDPFEYYGLSRPENVRLVPLSRGLPGIAARLPLRSTRLFVWSLKRWLAAQCTSTYPDILFVRHIKLAHACLSAFPKIPMLYEAHEIFAEGAPLRKRKRLARTELAVLKRAAAVVVITEALGRQLRVCYGLDRNLPVVASATSLPGVPLVKNWAESARSIIYAGSFFPWKGVSDLVAAAAFLPDCAITIIGGNDESIAEMQRSVPVGGGRIKFIGHLPQTEVMCRMAESCIAVLPNRAGSVSAFTSPLKLFEYMASGCALVVSDLPVFHEVLGETDAAWFEAGNAEQLAAAIRRLIDDPETARALSDKMTKMANNYTWPHRAEQLETVLRSLSPSRV